MPSTQSDRVDGFSTSMAVKVRCLYSTVGNIELRGLDLQSGGEWTDTLEDKTRILVQDQDDPIDNGIWVAGAGRWVRARDFDGRRDVTQGTIIFVYAGLARGNRAYHVTSADPIRIGETPITFALWPEIAGDADLVSFIQAGDGAITRTVQDRLRERISVKDFGAVGDGLTDDTPAVQAAIAYAELLRGTNDDSLVRPVLYFPFGVYRVNEELIINKGSITFEGDSPRASVITGSGDFGDSVRFVPAVTGGVNSIIGLCVKNIGFYRDTEPTTGAAIHLRDCRFARVENVEITNCFGGIRVVGGGDNLLTNIHVNVGMNFTTFRSGSYGVLAESSPSHDFPYVSFIADQLNIQGHQARADKGWYIKGADGIWSANSHIGGCKTNCHIQGASSANVKGVFFTQSYFDGFFSGLPTLDNIYIENSDNTAAMETFIFTGCEIVGASYNSASPYRGCNLHVKGIASSVMVIGGDIGYAGANGVWIEGAPKTIKLDGVLIRHNCSVDTAESEVLVEGTASGVELTGCTIGEIGSTATAAGPMLVQSSAANVTVRGLNFYGYGSGIVIVDTSSASTNRYLDVHVSDDSQIYTISSQASLAVRAHGDFYNVTGTTNISGISTKTWLGRVITLCFAGSLTVSNGSGLVIAGGTFAATANDTLTLRFNGSNWVEQSRAVN